MERKELVRRLDGFEWNDIEFKEARLATQGLIDPVGTGGRHALAEHPKERLGRTDQVGDQVGRPQGNLVTDQVESLTDAGARLKACRAGGG